MTAAWPAVWRTMRRTLWLASANLVLSFATLAAVLALAFR